MLFLVSSSFGFIHGITIYWILINDVDESGKCQDFLQINGNFHKFLLFFVFVAGYKVHSICIKGNKLSLPGGKLCLKIIRAFNCSIIRFSIPVQLIITLDVLRRL